MVVRELILALQAMDPDVQVIYCNYGAGWADGDCIVTSIKQQEQEDFRGDKHQVVILESDDGF